MKKIATITRVYVQIKKMFKEGKVLTIANVAKKMSMSNEGVRLHILKLVGKKIIKRNKKGSIIGIK